MVDSHSSRVPLPPAELVGNRIDENRLFEARFLFDKLSSAIDPEARGQLQQQLTTRIARAEQVFARGELLEQTGELEKAVKAYAEVSELAVDYPALVEAQQRVEIAIKLGPLHPVEPREPEMQETFSSRPLPAATREEETGRQVSGPSFLQHRKIILLLVFSLLTAVGAGSLVLFFRADDEPVAVRSIVPPMPGPQPPAQEPKEISPAASSEQEAAKTAAKATTIDRQQPNGPLHGDDKSIQPPQELPPAPVAKEKTDAQQKKPDTTEERISPKQTSGLHVSITPVAPIVLPVEPTPSRPTVRKSLPESVSSPQLDQAGLDNQAAREQKINSDSSLAVVPNVSRPKKTSVPLSEQEENAGNAAITEKMDKPARLDQIIRSQPQRTIKTTGEDSLYGISSDKPGQVVDPSVSEESGPGTPVEPLKNYTVKAGDTLETIAAKVYGNRYKWSQLVSANQEKLGHPPYILSVGMQLQVPPLVSSDTDDPAALLNDDGTYTVQSGDSLGTIAHKLYGSSRKWNMLYKLNRDQLPTPGALQVGQRLLVKENTPPVADSKDSAGK